MPQELTLLLILILVHLVADFFMQTQAGIVEKCTLHYRSKFLYLHAAIHGLLSLAVLWFAVAGLASVLGMAALISVSHLLFDLGKSYTPKGQYSWFILDQILHVSVILCVWLYVTNQWPLVELAVGWLLSPKPLIVLIAYILATRPLSFLIAIAIGKWSREIDNSGSLAEAGARIGLLERFLILTFILIDQFAAIGFLLAAKSVLRFGDLREPHHKKLTEYVLFGTMLSFATTISLGLLTRAVLTAL
ncbi:MAG: DUF3307 domain-containing protein [Gammaproteobacteria bacterium]|nr:DUF3307 domain-containing protein [Gammaproteobacteria bacterium]